MTETPRFTIVAPMLNEAGNVVPLTREIATACAPVGPFEAIYVNDGSTDATAAEISAMRAEFPWLREVHHSRSCGQSAALRNGVLAARAPLICTLDGDGQNPPAEIPKVLSPFLDARGFRGLVAGQRSQRRDSTARRAASRIANTLRAALLRDGVRDTGCGLKAFPRDVFLALPFFDHMHRYLPALVRREGLEVILIDVAHRPRQAGISKYSITARAISGAIDLIGVWWLMRRRKRSEVSEPAAGGED